MNIDKSVPENIMLILRVSSSNWNLLHFCHHSYNFYFVWFSVLFVVVQWLSWVWFFATPWTAACQASLSFTIFWSLFKLMSIELVMPSNHLILCHSLLLLPSIFPRLRSFPMSQHFASDGQSIGSSASASVLPVQGWSPGLIFLLSKKSRVFSSTTVRKHQFFGAQPSLWPNSQIHTWLLEKL